ncbi:MAG: SurA N-terminal domain-containing protein [Hyphomicrobiales bacterium]|nr:SurA N-terminal domain-containing protein [Hyphomicrobiales bacterium]
MLDVLRRGASTWISKLLLGLLIVSFGVWGIADVFRGFGSNTAYHVGAHEIGVIALDQDYQRELSQISRRIGRPFNKEEALKTGTSQQILSKIVTDATIVEAARLQGLAIPDETIREAILKDDSFKGPNGAFDRNRFVELLRSNGWNEDMYVMRRRTDMIRAQLLDGLSGGQPAPKAMVEALEQYRNETRKVRWAILTGASLGDLGAPDEADLQKFFAERARAFRAPERRTVAALILDPAAIARPGDVTDDDAKAEYDARKSAFVVPEQRRVLQISIVDTAAGAKALDDLKAGKSFEAVAEDLGQKAADIDLGLMAKSAFVDPKIAEAAFALPAVGDVSPIVDGRFGKALLKLAEIAPGATKSFAEVAPELKKEIAAKRAEGDLLSRHDQIEDALAGGAKLDEIAKRLSMKLTELTAIDREGRLADGSKPADIAKYDDLVKGAYESDVGVENDPIDLGGKGFMWYAVTAIDPAHDQTLAQVHDRALAAWKAEETAKRLAEKAKALTERLGKGEDFDEVAKSAGLDVKTSDAFKRGEKAEGLPAAAVTAAFTGPEGFVTTAASDAGDTVLLKVEDVTPPAFFAESEEAKAAAAQLGGSVRNSLLETWLGLATKDIGVTANRAVIDRVTGKARD